MNIDLLFASNPNNEQNGKWVWFGDEGAEGSFAFKLARAGGANSKYENRQQELLKPLQLVIMAEQRNPSPKTMDQIKRINQQAFVECCMLDWKNVKTKSAPDGLAFSKEAAIDLLNQYPELYDTLLGMAQSAATFREAEAKN